MSGKLFKAVIVAVLLALTLSIGSPTLATPSVMAAECGATACGH